MVVEEGVGAINGDAADDGVGDDPISSVTEALLTSGKSVTRLCGISPLNISTFLRPSPSGWRRTDCTHFIAATLLQKGEWDLPILDGIAKSPTIRQDGSILEREGYDHRSGLVVRLKQPFPPILRKPTKEDASSALELLRRPVRAVEFRGEVDCDVFVAAVLTGILRHTLDIAPMFMFSASVAGAGKTIMARAVAEIVTGNSGTMLTLTASEAENEKRLDAGLLKGDRVIIFDNCAQALEGNALCQVITHPSRDARVLGESRNENVSTKALLIATGNNLSARGDMAKRALLSYNEPKTERPENRHFDFDLLAEVRAQRPELVVAALTIVQAYAAAGRPPINVKPTRFPQWDQLVRQPLIWAGGCDVAETMDAVLEDDPDRMTIGGVLEAWHNYFGSHQRRASEVIEEISRPTQDPKLAALRSALIEALDVRPGAGPEAKQLGVWLGQRQNRIINDFKFDSGGTTKGAKRWRVVPAKEEL